MTLFPYPEEFIAYLAEYFGSRDYFECHEWMEALWKKEKGKPQENCWLVLVRVAVAQYHARRGNSAGAYKLLAKAAREVDPAAMDGIGLDGRRLAGVLRDRLAAWGGPNGVAYSDLELPITDPELLRLARQAASARGWAWGAPGDQVARELIDRHALRDRAEVIDARAAAAREKAQEREKRRHTSEDDA
ncbi:DUF309 domain-containing protein [Cohnella lubricantis]|uniref:DUF309 domain-containing protein n=1 Tax=Cohnella lubricantis TaxID=2163172 RepID=A0A841TEJ3_9BACL|nr:DUF309 domain-containing protein [Cohnella lubricantis]MBB6678676.1 DUF309 domain-containing protein [Cohnella lubricantis]MBP2118574.1 putative metal-dependent hydrolase [Cohnella lubricantis]